ncbi:hypothetical protein HJC23_003420 [Cyclotella cryptica]|uniref:Glycosyl transferase CAP10 domain-containing protein n=1 Tax=Cyclotella cryptica TaxID=29204 RepID=A0ABD3QYC8_9STRA
MRPNEMRQTYRICLRDHDFLSCAQRYSATLDNVVISAATNNATATNDYRKVSKYPASSPNEFVHALKESLHNDINGIEGLFTSLIITEDGRLLYRSLERDASSNRRIGHFLEMIRSGLAQNYQYFLSKYSHGMSGWLPVLLMVGDEVGCDITKHIDDHDFPRLTWSIPSDIHQGKDWCHGIGMPSYEIWKQFGKTYGSALVWDKTFQKHDILYPWTKKISKAVWRGSTTYDRSQYFDVAFRDIPRAKLVQASIDHPDVIDAAFTKIHQRFEDRSKELASETIVAYRLRFDEQMKYKAIVDIDGNNWSARFSRLLCTNSVIIKIDPDFIEYFYADLRPNVHYIPASLNNITEVVRYVLSKANEKEMINVTLAANLWCRKRLTTNSIINDAMIQLESYFTALNAYRDQETWEDDWKYFISNNPFNGLVEYKI